MKRFSATLKLSVRTVYCRTNRHTFTLIDMWSGQWECGLMGVVCWRVVIA